MQKPKLLLLAAIAIAGTFATSSCQLSRSVSTESDSGSVVQTDPRVRVYSGNYKLEGNRLILFSNAADSVVEFRFCSYSKSGTKDSLITLLDTPTNDTNDWRFEGDNLVLRHPTKTGYTPIDSIPFRTDVIYSRTFGRNTDLEGEYKRIGSHAVLLRRLPENSPDSTFVKMLVSLDPAWDSKIEDTRLILRKNEWTTTSRPLVSWADYQLLEWNGGQFPAFSDSADYDIVIRKIDDNTVTLKGNRNGELVTLRMVRPLPSTSLYGDIAYSSSDTSHHAGIEHYNLTSCPDGVDWYYDFRFANWRASSIGGAARLFGSSPAWQSRGDRGFSQLAPFRVLLQ